MRTFAVIACALTLCALLPHPAAAASYNRGVTACYPGDGASAVGCATATLYADTYACRKEGDGNWWCPVDYRLYLSVNGVAICGWTDSDMTSAASACALAGSAAPPEPARGYGKYAPGQLVQIAFKVCAHPYGTSHTATNTRICRDTTLTFSTPYAVSLNPILPDDSVPPVVLETYDAAAAEVNSALADAYRTMP